MRHQTLPAQPFSPQKNTAVAAFLVDVISVQGGPVELFLNLSQRRCADFLINLHREQDVMLGAQQEALHSHRERVRPLVKDFEVAMREFEHMWVGFEGRCLPRLTGASESKTAYCRNPERIDHHHSIR